MENWSWLLIGVAQLKSSEDQWRKTLVLHRRFSLAPFFSMLGSRMILIVFTPTEEN